MLAKVWNHRSKYDWIVYLIAKLHYYLICSFWLSIYGYRFSTDLFLIPNAFGTQWYFTKKRFKWKCLKKNWQNYYITYYISRHRFSKKVMENWLCISIMHLQIHEFYMGLQQQLTQQQHCVLVMHFRLQTVQFDN